MEDEPHRRPTVLVIFGGRGDLTWRKLVPALFNLQLDKSLPQPFALHARGPGGDQRRDAAGAAPRRGRTASRRRGPPADADWNSFVAAVTYQQADFDDPAAYSQLSDQLDRDRRPMERQGQSTLLSGHAAGAVRRDRPPAGRGGPGAGARAQPHRGGKAAGLRSRIRPGS